MKVVILKDYDEVSRAGADIVEGALKAKPDMVLGLATGSTPVGMYEELARRVKAGGLSFSKARSYNLDEYVGIPVTHEQSYHRFMQENLFDHVDFKEGANHVPWTDGKNSEKDCADYDAAIRNAGGIDLQILGIGGNGHIAFNEPADALVYGTHITELDQRTIKDNARFFDSEADVPRQAITMGIGPIMAAREIIIMATGANKQDAVEGMLLGGITGHLPASMLRLHPNVTVLLDEAAAGKLGKPMGKYDFY